MHYISTTNIIIANNSLQVIIFTKLHTNFFLAMIKLFILFTIVLQVSQLPAQCPVTFNYDAAGNRILRTTPCALQGGQHRTESGEQSQHISGAPSQRLTQPIFGHILPAVGGRAAVGNPIFRNR